MENCEYVLESKKYEKNEFIGKGSFGEVFTIKKDGKTYVMKIIKLSPVANAINSEPNFLNEVKITKIAFDNKLGPEVVDWWICGYPQKYGVMIIEKFNITLYNYLQTESIPKYEKICTIVKCLYKLKKLHENDICHGDLTQHLGNIMLNDKGAPYFIDFGSSTLAFLPNQNNWCYFFEMKNFLKVVSKTNIFGDVFKNKFIYDFPKESTFFKKNKFTLGDILNYEDEYYKSVITFIEDNLLEIIS